jgi:1-acyl-sn-glycerol-3-phosphate acyltransferase
MHPLDETFRSRAPWWLRHRVGRRAFAVGRTVDMLRALKASPRFGDLTLALGITVVGRGEIPQGPVVVVANHPCANVDLWSLGAAVEQQRGGDVRGVVDGASRPMVELRSRYLFVGEAPVEREAFWADSVAFVAGGGALVVFPAGQTNVRGRDGVPIEPPWRGGALKIAARAGARIVPAWIDLVPPPWYDRLRRHLPRMAVQPLNLRLIHGAPGEVSVRFGAPFEPVGVDAAGLRERVYGVGRTAFRPRSAR